MKNFRSILLFQLAVAFTAPFSSLAQGNLTPPGPPAPTMKTLDQIQPGTPISSIPYSISNSGSYYFTTNLSGSSGISISTNNVTLDLRGFTLRGNGSASGIYASSAVTNLVIRNGIIIQWFSGLIANSSRNCRFERLTFSQNAYAMSAGQSSLASDCLAEQNSQSGFEFDMDARIINCIARYNGAYGFNVNEGANITGCIAAFNGLDGFFVDRCMIRDCFADGNTNNGINAFINCVVMNNRCYNNKIAGITSSEGDHRIDGNDVTANAFGILLNASTQNLVIHNTATENFTNYNIEAGNTVGPIISGAAITTNTTPAANYSY